MERLIIDGTAVYELDEDCMCLKRKREEDKRRRTDMSTSSQELKGKRRQ